MKNKELMFVDQVDLTLNDIKVSDDIVATALIPNALTAGELVFSNMRPRFSRRTVNYCTSKRSRPTRGEWYAGDDGRFGSFWPPSYRATYDLRWIVENGAIVGLRFLELGRGSQFDGRYRIDRLVTALGSGGYGTKRRRRRWIICRTPCSRSDAV